MTSPTNAFCPTRSLAEGRAPANAPRALGAAVWPMAASAAALLLMLGGCGMTGYSPYVSGVKPSATDPKTMVGPAVVQLSAPKASAVASGQALTQRTGEATTAAPSALALADEAAAGRVATDETPGESADGPEGLRRVSFAEDGSDFNPRLSKDGTKMVFASTQHRATSDIYVQSVGGRTITQLTNDPGNDVMPTLSPDGSRLAFASDRTGRWQLYVMSATGGQAVQLTGDNAHDLHPSWSPDGERIVFSRLGARSGRWELWVLSVANPIAAEFIGYGLFPEWCPTPGTGANGSDRILFQRGRERGDRAFGVWTIDYKPGSAGNPTEIVSARGIAAITPTWSPDGQWIAYSTLPAAQAPAYEDRAITRAPKQGGDLWIATIDGTARVNLTNGRHASVMPAWAPDNRVYFVSDRNGVDNVWSVATEKAIASAGRTGPGGVAQAAKANAKTATASGTGEKPESGTSVADAPTEP
jgi:TolB protein